MSILNKLASFFNRRDKGDLKLFTEVVDEKLRVLGHDISLLELEYNLRTASGEWLDEWGSWFGVYRGMDEDDDSYRYRILTSLARATSTLPAILNSVLEYYSVQYGDDKYSKDDISILEPYTLLKKFSECGDFSGTHRYQDGEYYRHHTIEITLPESVTPELRQMVDKTKAGGIKVYYKISQSELPSEDGSDGIVSIFSETSPMTGNSLLSDLDHAVIKYGTIRSKFVPYNQRSRSGKRILDAVEVVIKIDFNISKSHTYKEISEFWNIMCSNNHTTPVWVPKTDNSSNLLSVHTGARSGDRDGHWEYRPVEEVFADSEDNVLQLPVIQERAYIKPARRSRCGNGHSLGYPRSGLRDENYDHTQKEYVYPSEYIDDTSWKINDWSDSTVFTEMLVPLLESNVLSDSFIVSEYLHDEQQFNILSETTNFADSGYYSDSIPYSEAIHTEVQSSVQHTSIKELELTNKEEDGAKVYPEATHYSEMRVRRNTHIVTNDGSEILICGSFNLIVGDLPYDKIDIEVKKLIE